MDRLMHQLINVADDFGQVRHGVLNNLPAPLLKFSQHDQVPDEQFFETAVAHEVGVDRKPAAVPRRTRAAGNGSQAGSVRQDRCGLKLRLTIHPLRQGTEQSPVDGVEIPNDAFLARLNGSKVARMLKAYGDEFDREAVEEITQSGSNPNQLHWLQIKRIVMPPRALHRLVQSPNAS